MRLSTEGARAAPSSSSPMRTARAPSTKGRRLPARRALGPSASPTGSPAPTSRPLPPIAPATPRSSRRRRARGSPWRICRCSSSRAGARRSSEPTSMRREHQGGPGSRSARPQPGRFQHQGIENTTLGFSTLHTPRSPASGAGKRPGPGGALPLRRKWWVWLDRLRQNGQTRGFKRDRRVYTGRGGSLTLTSAHPAC
jgi:hypothetical protein